VASSQNEIYITGHTLSYTNMTTAGAHQESFFGVSAAFLAKFTDQGQLLWSTYYGSAGFQEGYGIALDANENVVFSGFSNSSSGIASPGAYQTTLAGELDAFLVKFNPAGERIWGTYYGGTNDDHGFDVCIDDLDNIYMMGNTNSSTGISFGTGYQQAAGSIDDGFVAKFTAAGALQWGTYIGGNEAEYLSAIKMYFDQGVVVVGKTQSNNAIASNDALVDELVGQYDACMIKLSSTGEWEWGTYYGGALSDEFYGLAIAPSNGYLHAVGVTSSEAGIATAGADQTESTGGFFNGFLVQFCAPFIPVLMHNIYPVNCGESSFLIEVAPNDVFDTYLWSDGSTSSNLNLMDLSLGNYTVYLNTLDTNSCAYVSDTLNFEVAPDMLNQVTVTGAQEIYCQGDTVYLLANAGFESYAWTSGGNTIEENAVLDAVDMSFIAVLVEDELGCIDHDTVFFQVNPAPNIEFQLIGSTNFCVGETLEIVSQENYTSYLWNNGETTSSILLSEEAWVWLNATNEYGCSSLSDSFFVSASELFPKITTDALQPFCPNELILFYTENTFDTYLWNSVDNSSEYLVYPSQLEQYVSVEVTNLCGGYGVDTFYFNMLPEISFDILFNQPEEFCVGTSTAFSVLGEFTDIQWQNTVLGANYLTQAPEVGPWQIVVQALDTNLCAVFDTLNLVVENCYVGIHAQSNNFSLFPNPFSETIHILGLQEEHVLVLRDTQGRLVHRTSVNEQLNQINLSQYASGVYFIEIYALTKELVFKYRVIKG
jgi:hypothetical protein